MKANEAPEKIYIAAEEEYNFSKSDSEIAWSYKPPFDSIEYTRTDAFMKNTDKLLGMLLEAIDYSFLQVDGSYDKSLTYPVIDKIQYIKEQVRNIEVKEVDFHKELLSFYRHANSGSTIELAKHFFELGIAVSNKAQKGE